MDKELIANKKSITLERAQINPVAVQTILLDEIAGRLLDIHDMLKDMVADGVDDTFSIEASDEKIQVVSLQPWLSVSIFNDGPDGIYLLVNREERKAYEPKLYAGENTSIDAKKHSIRQLFIFCDEGETASVRIRALI